MPRKQPTPPVGPQPWPKEFAIRRLQEAVDDIPSLKPLNNEDPKFEAWYQNVLRILAANWPDERLPDFQSYVIPLGHDPYQYQREKQAYDRGLTHAETQLKLILRNEQELAEAKGNTAITELFLPAGSQHDAYSHIRNIVSSAKLELLIVDNYVDTSLFQLLTNVNPGVAIELLTYRVPGDFALEAGKFRAQHGASFEARLRKADFHDRFIIVDSTKAHHLGASIKDAGNKASMIHLIEDTDNVSALLTTARASWVNAQLLP